MAKSIPLYWIAEATAGADLGSGDQIIPTAISGSISSILYIELIYLHQ